MSDERVALCPVTDELLDQLVGLAGLDLTDREAVEALLLELGWQDFYDAIEAPAYQEAFDVPEADLVSPAGHFAHCDGDGAFSMPFSYLYSIRNELLTDDLWGDLPGWRSEEGAWRAEFDAHTEALLHRLTARLGPPDYDIRQPKYHARTVSWRLERNVLMVVQGTEPISYHQFEHGQLYLGSRTAERPYFPDDTAMRTLVTS